MNKPTAFGPTAQSLVSIFRDLAQWLGTLWTVGVLHEPMRPWVAIACQSACAFGNGLTRASIMDDLGSALH